MGPRVLVDATAVPADRGGVGRYVDGLIAALGEVDANLAVVCQRSDAERYSRLAPQATVVPGPPAISHRPARLAWEQTGLALVAQQVKAEVVHSPHYTMPLRVGRPVVVTDPRRDVLHRAGDAHGGEGDLLPLGDADGATPGGALHRAEQGDPRRGDPGAGRGPDEARRRLPRCRRRPSFTLRAEAEQERVRRSARAGPVSSYIAFPRGARAPQERSEPDPRLERCRALAR